MNPPPTARRPRVSFATALLGLAAGLGASCAGPGPAPDASAALQDPAPESPTARVAGAAAPTALDGESAARGREASTIDLDTAPAELRSLRAGPPPTELFPVLRVVDGDTLHIERGGETVKLRLLSVDTEEKPSGRKGVDPLKPETGYGQATTDWAIELFERLAVVDGRMRVGLRFPEGEEQLDVYGRLLCHVVLPDGSDYNLGLVALGRSPYFNKYGESRIDHARFVAAQQAARERQLGIWDPRTNLDVAAGEPSVVRPYDALLPWWDLRAAAVAAFRTARAADPGGWAAADEPASLAAAESAGRPVQVFGAIDRWFDEDDGSWTLLFRSGDRDAALRAKISAEDLPRFDRASIEAAATEPFVQNYLVLEGTLGRGRRGFEMWLADPDQLRVAPARAPEGAP